MLRSLREHIGKAIFLRVGFRAHYGPSLTAFFPNRFY